jgi:hypothetical protein
MAVKLTNLLNPARILDAILVAAEGLFDLNLTPLHRKNQRLNTANSLT